MAKRLFLLVIISLIHIGISPNVLMADNFLAKQPEFNAVETVEIVEKTELAEGMVIAAAPDAGVIRSVLPVATTEQKVTTPVYPTNNIIIDGKTIEIIDVTDTMVDSGGHVNKYGDKFLYGHNSAVVFGGLKNFNIGYTFTINYGGRPVDYRVQKVVIYEKNVGTGQLQLNGEGSYMRSVSKARSEGEQYDVALMTCYGTAYGNGDASHRLVWFANAV